MKKDQQKLVDRRMGDIGRSGRILLVAIAEFGFVIGSVTEGSSRVQNRD